MLNLSCYSYYSCSYKKYTFMEKQPKFDYSDIKFKDNGKLKLIIVVGTRPEIIRLAAVINKCRQYFDVILAHTGQNYDYNLNGIFFKDLKLAEPEVRTGIQIRFPAAPRQYQSG